MKTHLYDQIAQQLKDKIAIKQWQDNERLPSIRSLSNQYQVSKITIQNALHKLEASGLIKAKSKSGYFVVPQTPHIEKVGENKAVELPKLVDVPKIFHEIMQHSAAFDIYPSSSVQPLTNHKQLLNRHINRAMRNNAKRDSLYYGPPQGVASLREQIAKHYRNRELYASADDFCITSGCQNSLFIALSATCNEGDVVAIESPTFYGVLQLLEFLKLKVIEIPSSFTQGLKSADLAKVLSQWKIKACVITSSFSTPTGACIPDEEKERIYQISVEHNFTIIEDDVYGDLGFHFIAKPIKAFDTEGNVILCGSFSKSLSRDLRVGWIIGGKHKAKINHIKLINQLSNNQAIQQGLASYMAEGGYRRHLYQFHQQLINQRDQLLSLMRQHWQFSYQHRVPEGGLSLWIGLAKNIDTIALYNEAIKHNIVLPPGALFTSNNEYSNYFRLSYVHPINNERLTALKTVNELIKNK